MPAADETFLQTPRLQLRKLQSYDVESLYQLRADPEVTRYQSWDEFTREDAEAMVEEMRSAMPGRIGSWYQFGIAPKQGGELIGDCALRRLAEAPHTAEIGYTIALAHQRQGYGRESIGALIGYAFGTLGLHRVIAITDTRNEASNGLLQALGFRQEAHYVEAYDDQGTWTDEYLFALLRREWRP